MRRPSFYLIEVLKNEVVQLPAADAFDFTSIRSLQMRIRLTVCLQSVSAGTTCDRRKFHIA